jgi:hypothetical protein
VVRIAPDSPLTQISSVPRKVRILSIRLLDLHEFSTIVFIEEKVSNCRVPHNVNNKVKNEG